MLHSFNRPFTSVEPIKKKIHNYASCETSMAVMFQVEVFWFVTPYSVVDLWNVGILPQHYAGSQPRRPRLEVQNYFNDFRFSWCHLGQTKRCYFTV